MGCVEGSGHDPLFKVKFLAKGKKSVLTRDRTGDLVRVKHT